jgi:hypothetical protein
MSNKSKFHKSSAFLLMDVALCKATLYRKKKWLAQSKEWQANNFPDRSKE